MPDAGPLLVTSALNPALAFQAGLASASQLAIFADSNTSVLSGSAAINWGDGQTETTQILGANGTFSLFTGHNYSADGSFSITITFTDADGYATTSGMAVVSPAVVTPTFPNFFYPNFTVGQAGTYTFTASGAPLSSLSEAGPLPGGLTFTDNGSGKATLAGTPVAGSSGTYYFYLTAANGGSMSTTQSYVLTVNAASSSSSLTLQPITDQWNATGDNVVLHLDASTTAAAPNNAISYMAIGLPPGVSSDGAGQLSGQIAAGDSGAYAVTVWAYTSQATVSQSFTWSVVAPAPSMTVHEMEFPAYVGETYSGAIATFHDANSGSPGDYTAQINWGDQGNNNQPTVTQGQLTQTPDGGPFLVSGVYTYSQAGQYPVSVTVTKIATGDQASTTFVNVAYYGEVSTVIKTYFNYNSSVWKSGNAGFDNAIKLSIQNNINVYDNDNNRPIRGGFIMPGNSITTSGIVDSSAITNGEKDTRQALAAIGFTDISFNYKAQIFYEVLDTTTGRVNVTVRMAVDVTATDNMNKTGTARSYLRGWPSFQYTSPKFEGATLRNVRAPNVNSPNLYEFK